MSKNYIFDAFLSYNSNDIIQVSQIANELKKFKLNIWFDKWNISPGEQFISNIFNAISQSLAIVAFIGPSGVGPWEEAEINNAFVQFIRDKKTIIPVLLPGTELDIKMPSYLDVFHVIDYRTLDASKINLDPLINAISRREIDKNLSQIKGEHEIKILTGSKNPRKLKVFSLFNPSNEKLLDITWQTLGTGIELLKNQIRNYGCRIHIDACIGINDAGLIIGTFLNSSILGNKKIGYLRFAGPKVMSFIQEEFSFLPVLCKEPSIMLVDFELKSGKNLETVVKTIKNKYPKTSIYLSVFSALINDEDQNINFDNLDLAGLIHDLKIKDIFIAFIMKSPGIEPPLELR